MPPFCRAIGLPLFALTSKRLLESVLSLAEQSSTGKRNKFDELR